MTIDSTYSLVATDLENVSDSITELYAQTGDEKLLQALKELASVQAGVRISWLYRDVVLSKKGE